MTAHFSIHRVRALFAKEVTQITRDPSVFLIAFFVPLVLLVIFGFGVSLDASRTRVGIALQDDGAAALSLAGAYQNSRWFDVRIARHVAPLREMMVDGQVRGIIVIPPDFSRRRALGEATPIQIITDASFPNNASFVAAYAEGLRASWAANEAAAQSSAAARAAGPRISFDTRYWFNPGLTSRYFLVPGSIAIVMMMIGTLLTSLVVAREWERGTMEAMMATPMHMTEFIASKILPYFLLALCSMALCTLLAVTLFGIPFRGSVWALLASTAAFLMPALGQGLLISSWTKNQFAASQIALLSGFMPTFLLSGFLFEIGSMPPWIQAITYLVPARYFVPTLQTIFAAGDIWALILPNVAILLLFGAAFFFLSFHFSRRSLD